MNADERTLWGFWACCGLPGPDQSPMSAPPLAIENKRRTPIGKPEPIHRRAILTSASEGPAPAKTHSAGSRASSLTTEFPRPPEYVVILRLMPTFLSLVGRNFSAPGGIGRNQVRKKRQNGLGRSNRALPAGCTILPGAPSPQIVWLAFSRVVYRVRRNTPIPLPRTTSGERHARVYRKIQRRD